jgi:hypothetical protein
MTTDAKQFKFDGFVLEVHDADVRARLLPTDRQQAALIILRECGVTDLRAVVAFTDDVLARTPLPLVLDSVAVEQYLVAWVNRRVGEVVAEQRGA